MSSTTADLLRQALDCLDEERRDLDQRRQLIEDALGNERSRHIQAVTTESDPLDEPEARTLSISDSRLAQVQQYLVDHGSARQADIAHDLSRQWGVSQGAASGAVSTALRKLRATGVVKPGSVEDGSRVWETVRVIAAA